MLPSSHCQKQFQSDLWRFVFCVLEYNDSQWIPPQIHSHLQFHSSQKTQQISQQTRKWIFSKQCFQLAKSYTASHNIVVTFTHCRVILIVTRAIIVTETPAIVPLRQQPLHRVAGVGHPLCVCVVTILDNKLCIGSNQVSISLQSKNDLYELLFVGVFPNT